MFLGSSLILSAAGYAGDDLTVSKKITVGGNSFSSQTLLKGARERTSMDMGTGSPMITIRQCDLKRSLNVNDGQKTYLIKPDLEEADSSKAAAVALLGGAQAQDSGGTVTYSSTVKDTGEKKQLYGYTARHLKITVVSQSSPNSCNAVKQKYEIDGWYIDIKDQANCQRFSPFIKDVQGCHDHVVLKQTGSAKPGLAVQETISLTNGDDQPMVITTEVTELKKGALAPELFDAPADYKQVSTTAELYGAPATATQTAQAGGAVPTASYAQQQPLLPPQQPQQKQKAGMPNIAQMMLNPAAAASSQMAMQQQAMSQLQQAGMAGSGMSPMNGMPGSAAPQGGTPVAAPQALGPKAPGKIRVGVAPPDAQLGQGNNAGADYSTPVRNAIIALMSGPAVEIAALDSRTPVQLQAEAQQKQCDFILYSAVAVKHSSGGGLGGFLKKAGPMSSMIPMAGMARGMGGAVAAQAASAAASAAAVSAQQQAMNQLAGFNGQIKSKDDVSIQYQLYPTGQASPRLQNELKGKAKSDGEDVLTPLLQQTANNVLTEVSKK